MSFKKMLAMWAVGALAIVGAWLGAFVVGWLATLVDLAGLNLEGWVGTLLFVLAAPLVAHATLQVFFPGARPMRAPWRRALAAFRDADVAHRTVGALRERGIRAQLAGRSDLDDRPGGLEITVSRADFSAARDVLRELKLARVGVAQP